MTETRNVPITSEAGDELIGAGTNADAPTFGCTSVVDLGVDV